MTLDLRRLRAERIAKGLTQDEMAEKMGWKTRIPCAKRENGLVAIGADELARNANNFAGHKYDNNIHKDFYIKDAYEYENGQEIVDENAKWGKYDNFQDFCKSHFNWFTSNPTRTKIYANVLSATTADRQAYYLMGTYATDLPRPTSIGYYQKLMNIINQYNLTQYDNIKETDTVSKYTPTIIDRRQYAMGGQAWNRNKSAISVIAWHYTAVARKLNRKIWDHEQYWKNTHGWDRGGYHYYIDSDGVIYHNYNYERITWGVAYNNDYTVHISVEANSASDYSEAQKKAREWLTRKIMSDLGIKSNKVLMHKEVYNNSNCCGYTTTQMNEFRNILSKAQETTPVLDDRFVELPTYRTPVNPFRELKEGDKITIRKGIQAWHNPSDDPKKQGDEANKASRDFVGRTGTIKKVKAVSVGYSKRAYLIVDEENPKDPLNSWIFEHDVVEARSHWMEVDDDAPEQAIPETDDPSINDDLEPAPDNDFRENYIYWESKKYRVGDEITE